MTGPDAYDRVLAKWPQPVGSLDVATSFGTTRVHACGPAGADPVLLLHSGGATSTVWYATVPALLPAHRVYAPDRIGDTGRSVPNGRPVRRVEDLMDWLDEVVTGLGLDRVALVGHSYGAWLALRYALHAPGRVSRLALLDPTDCFAGLSLRYRLRAIPLLLRPSPARVRSFLAWETGGVALDPDWLEVTAQGANPRPLPRPPAVARLRELTTPTLVLLAERSRAHDIRRVQEGVRRAMPDARIVVLEGATHSTIPAYHHEQLNRELAAFLG